MNRLKALCTGTMLATLAAAPVAAQDLDRVRTNSITAYTGFYIYVADEMGFFEKHGIDASPKWFPSGAPIMQAAAAGQWDMTFLGAPPTVIGGPSLGLVTVGMIAEEGGMHQLIGRPDYVAEVREDPAKMQGAQILVTTLSTGHYMTESCLQSMGLTTNDVNIIPSEQQATLSAFTAGQADLAQAWSPQTTALTSRGNEILCDAAELGLSMPGVSVAHPNFIERAEPELIERWLAATLDAVDWILEDRERTFELYKEYDAFRGFNFSDELLEGEVDLVMDTYMGLEEQLEMLQPTPDGGQPPITIAFEEIAEFFIRQGRMDEVPNYAPYVDASYLEALQEAE
jgi:NitT/TauT family transport system substrate-binding protein